MPKIDQNVYEGIVRVLLASGQLEQVTSTFCMNAKERVEQLLDATLNKSDAKIANVAHALKGSCAMFGAKGCADLCQQIENCSQSDSDAYKYIILKDLIETLRQDLGEVFDFLKKQIPPTNPECCP